MGGITQNSLRATALSITTDSIDTFLERMRHITQGMTEKEGDRRSSSSTAPMKIKDGTCRNCGKKGHHHKECRIEVNCFYCKEKDHRTFDCPSLKKKGKGFTPKFQSTAALATANVTGDIPTSGSVASVSNLENIRLEIQNPFIRINKICNFNCELLALIDTGSPVSFIKLSIYEKYVKLSCVIFN